MRTKKSKQPELRLDEPETVLDEDMVERIVAAVVAEYEAEDSDLRVSRTLLRNAINLATQKPLHVWAAFRDGQEWQYRIIQVRDINDTTGVGMVLQTQYRVGGGRSWCVLEDTSPICEDLVRLAQLQSNARTAEPD